MRREGVGRKERDLADSGEGSRGGARTSVVPGARLGAGEADSTFSSGASRLLLRFVWVSTGGRGVLYALQWKVGKPAQREDADFHVNVGKLVTHYLSFPSCKVKQGLPTAC